MQEEFYFLACFDIRILTIEAQRRNMTLHFAAQHHKLVPVINQLNAQNLVLCLLYASTCFEHCCDHHQEVKFVLYSLWYHHTETSEWSKITKIQFYKYEHKVVKFMYEFFGCDCCIFLTINMLCHAEVTFIQLLNLLKRYYLILFNKFNKFNNWINVNST